MAKHRMNTVPLTSTNRTRAESRIFGSLTAGAALALVMAAFGASSALEDNTASDCDMATVAVAPEALADSVPRCAATHPLRCATGHERAVTVHIDVDVGDVQGECAPVPGGDSPAQHPPRSRSSPDDRRADATI
jgi:hypothetical protein